MKSKQFEIAYRRQTDYIERFTSSVFKGSRGFRPQKIFWFLQPLLGIATFHITWPMPPPSHYHAAFLYRPSDVNFPFSPNYSYSPHSVVYIQRFPDSLHASSSEQYVQTNTHTSYGTPFLPYIIVRFLNFVLPYLIFT